MQGRRDIREDSRATEPDKEEFPAIKYQRLIEIK